MGELKSVIEQSFTQYSGAVLQSRALIDVRDGLKPSARQIGVLVVYVLPIIKIQVQRYTLLMIMFGKQTKV